MRVAARSGEAVSPAELQQQVREAHALLQRGDADAADRVLQPALCAAPHEPNVRHLAALIRRAQGDLAGALADFDAALAAAPNAARIHLNRAALLAELGRHKDALASCDAAARLGLDHAALWSARGAALSHLGRHNEAIAAYDRALALEPRAADTRANRARAFLADGRYQEAITDYDTLLQQQPGDAGLWDNRGVALFKLDRLDEAEASLSEALRLRPDHPGSLSNLGLTLFGLGRPEAAIAAFDRSLALSADAEPAAIASLRYNRGMAFLARGDFEAGWDGLEARWAAGMINSAPLDHGEPAWRGGPVDGVLRIWPEQGIGDQILFARLAPLARERAGQVMLQCDARLAPLFARSFPNIDVIGAASQPAAAQCAIGSLGAVMRAKREDLGGGAAFLRADQRRAEEVRARYQALANGRPIVGIAWSSSVPGRGEWKTADLSHWRPLLERDLFFVSLQYGETQAHIEAARAGFGVDILVDAQVDQMTDLDAFAAQIAALDRVVSVSNTTVHMAGALGVNCIVMPPPARGRLWYWSIEGDTTPWYSSVRIVRRSLGESWETQVARAAALLPC
jgi:tetratricopeptide (TPR) repeat protein